ncbi:hypothetical protein AB0N09_32635 [Streptomyces erythrochromogenes]|uniref:hypothetical protein n=1 Tax=Streptomyces erythrochromogenes TaxID=285574 RepID=UPI0034217386
MYAVSHEQLHAQRVFLDARLAELGRIPGCADLVPAVQALVSTVRRLEAEAEEARARGDLAGYDTAARRLQTIADRWSDHPDYRPDHRTAG